MGTFDTKFKSYLIKSNQTQISVCGTMHGKYIKIYWVSVVLYPWSLSEHTASLILHNYKYFF